jgi:threonine dehydrogenase-like Zn-dependent dehydrogenase
MWRDPGHERWGCYAEYVSATAENVIEIGDKLPLEKVVSLELGMCVQVSFDELLQVMDLEGKRIAIGGLGPSGLVAVQLAKAYGATEVVGIDPVQERRGLSEQLGADWTAKPNSSKLPKDRRSKKAFDAAVDCTGLPASIEGLMNRTKRAVGIFGVLREDVRFGAQHWGGLTLMGYVPHNRGAAERALKCIEQEQLNLEPLISKKLPLAQYTQGIALLQDKQAIKICFLPGE